jgi:hypothetical protein
MNTQQFYKEVKKLRQLQKTFARNRSSFDIDVVIRQERLIDAEITRVETLTANANKEKTGEIF